MDQAARRSRTGGLVGLGERNECSTSNSRPRDVLSQLDRYTECAWETALEQTFWRVVRARLRETRAPEAFVPRLRRVIAAEQATSYDWLVGERS